MYYDIEQQTKVTCLGELADPQAEKTYQLARLPQSKRRIRFVCAATAVAYLCAIYADSLVMSGSALYLLVAGRCLAAMIGIVPFLFSFQEKTSPGDMGLATGVYMAAIMAGECLELYLKGDMALVNGTPITAFIVVCYYLFLPPQLWQSLIAGGLGSVAYILTLTFFTNISAGHAANTFLIFALANGFGLYYSIRFGAAQRREYMALTELKRKAEIDAHTGVLNRRRLDELCELAFREAKRSGTPCSLLLMDIDYFKAVNELEGYTAGDAVLAALAERCSHALRLVDVFGRIGGEEFAIFMPHATPEQAQQMAERLRKTVKDRPFQIGRKSIPITVSIGGASLSSEIEELDSLFQKADKALYRAKRCGRDRVRF